MGVGAGLRQRRGSVIIATDDDRVRDAAIGFGADFADDLRRHQHRARIGSPRSRVSAAFGTDDIVVNVQGDEPLIEPG